MSVGVLTNRASTDRYVVRLAKCLHHRPALASRWFGLLPLVVPSGRLWLLGDSSGILLAPLDVTTGIICLVDESH